MKVWIKIVVCEMKVDELWGRIIRNRGIKRSQLTVKCRLSIKRRMTGRCRKNIIES